MKNLAEYYAPIKERIANLKQGIKTGWDLGFQKLGDLTGRVERGQIWVVGGASGTGKSYFILNIIDTLSKTNKDLKMCVFSTELSPQTYIYRHVLMRSGVYKLVFERQVDRYYDRVAKNLEDYFDRVQAQSNSLQIFGEITNFEQIIKSLRGMETMPDIVFVDYIQELSIEGKFNKKDSMPILSARFKEFASKHGTVFFLVSQVTNQSIREDTATNRVASFDFGKELNNSAHTSVVLNRKKFENGKLASHVDIFVTKAREGELGAVSMEIDGGYKVHEIDRERTLALDIITQS